MSEILERLLALLQEGTWPIMLPLIAVCVGISSLAVERLVYLYGPRQLASWVWPPARRRLHALRATVQEALDGYLVSPSRGNSRRLLLACREHATPYTRFLARALRGGAALLDPRFRDLHLAEAELEEQLEIERNLGLLSTLSKLAPLLGLLGTVTGMIQTFSVMMLASTSDPRALSSGISIALIATEVGLIVGLPGVVTMGCLSRRAQTLEEEISLASMRLRQAAGRLAGEGCRA
jgi:biopolymer transport protein ExbB/TolQ